MSSKSHGIIQQKAAQLALGADPIKHALATCLFSSENGELAATVACKLFEGVPGIPDAAGLTRLLSAEPIFKLQHSTVSGDTIISLNIEAMMHAAKTATSTGVLLEELPPPEGYVQGQYPIRPSQVDCSFYMKNGRCSFGRNCVFNHPPDRAPTSQHIPYTTTASSSSASSSAAAMYQQPQPPHMYAAAGPSHGSSSTANKPPQQPFSQQHQHQQYHHHQQQQQQQYSQQYNQQYSHQMPGQLHPVTGTTEQGLPLRPGAANCPYYMHTKSCKFGRQCMYHHPEHPAQPIKYVQSGYMSGKWRGAAPYFRLVMHLDRMWDYSSSPAAQIKTWLARHLLAEANPSCGMWTDTAAAPAADEGAGVAGSSSEKPLGSYSCSLSEAGLLLHKLWQEQPDAAASSPMPYGQRLRDLLQGDPYFDVLPDPGNATHWLVRLNVGRIKETLNW